METIFTGPRFRIFTPLISRMRGRAGRVGCLIVGSLIALFALRGCTMKYVPPDQIGLRQVSFGPGKGLQRKLVLPGYRREILAFETIQTFPRNVQVVEFTNSAIESSDKHRTVRAIKVPTIDGYPVDVDITVLYRIADPFLVVSKFGFGRGYEDSVVLRFTDPAVKHHLGALRAEEFYKDGRQLKARAMKVELANHFKNNGLQLLDVLIRQYDYPSTFQGLTEQKKIQDQSVLTNREIAKQAEVQTRLNQVIGEGQNAMNISTAEFQARITGINAERDLYERQKRAEADLLVRSAEASGTEMINRSMEGAGSDKLLRLRKGLAILNGIRGPIYITDDPTDLSKARP